jgi:predicted pyridoxine 5'-phosphate oxidase superfamily flavin-nucleotide-binding protein
MGVADRPDSSLNTGTIADRLVQVKAHDRFTNADREFIEQQYMFFLATVDSVGQPTCSYKGGDRGYVRVLDHATLVFPNYDGNGMYLSIGNLMETHAVGLLFIDFAAQRRLRVEGTARLSMDDSLMSQFSGAQFIVRVEVRRIYPNCPRYIHKYELVQASEFVPHPEKPAPVPAWKQADWAVDVLPANDPARVRNVDR